MSASHQLTLRITRIDPCFRFKLPESPPIPDILQRQVMPHGLQIMMYVPCYLVYCIVMPSMGRPGCYHRLGMESAAHVGRSWEGGGHAVLSATGEQELLSWMLHRYVPFVVDELWRSAERTPSTGGRQGWVYLRISVSSVRDPYLLMQVERSADVSGRLRWCRKWRNIAFSISVTCIFLIYAIGCRLTSELVDARSALESACQSSRPTRQLVALDTGGYLEESDS